MLSGSIDVVIKTVLGKNERFFKTINSNMMRFSEKGLIDEIIGTEYDFHGKADYIKGLIKRYNVYPYEVLYVGNSGNDRFAYLSGARTLCINPHFTDSYENREWTHQIRRVDSLKEILPFIFPLGKDYTPSKLPSLPHNKTKAVDITKHSFEVAFSFPGEVRDYVESIASELEKEIGPNSYFYDNKYKAQLARPSLDKLLQDIYRNRSKLIVVFLCQKYEDKKWCGVEFRVISEIIMERKLQKVMFVRMDESSVEGVFKTDGYIDGRSHTPSDVAGFIKERVSLIS